MTPGQEHKLGQAMLAHEQTIDRAYLYGQVHNDFPNRTKPTLGIIKYILSKGEGDFIRTGEFTRLFNYNTVYTVIKKLVTANALTLSKILPGGTRLYSVTPANRTVLQSILQDG
jgi:hypothetical protein